MYYYFFFDENKDIYGGDFLTNCVEDLLGFEVLNICAHFNDDYFKIDDFYYFFYQYNFSYFLSNTGEKKLDNKFILSQSKVVENYKKFIDMDDNIHILVLQTSTMKMLKNLLINFDEKYERKVAHYTNYQVSKLLVTNQTSLRLASTDYMNDPSEGKIFFKYLQLNEMEFDSHNKTFLTCFTLNHNSLNQFRLYGLEENLPCTGISLVYDSKFFFNLESFAGDFILSDERAKESLKDGLKIPLFRCIYLDSFTGHFEVAKRNKFTFYQEMQDRDSANRAWSKYVELMNDVENQVDLSFKKIINTLSFIKGRRHNLSINELRAINKIFKPISFLVKHFSFQEEQECRMIVLEKIESDNVIMDEANKSYSYIEYDQPTDRDIKNIYIGLASSNRMVELLKIIKQVRKRDCPKTMVSDNPYRV